MAALKQKPRLRRKAKELAATVLISSTLKPLPLARKRIEEILRTSLRIAARSSALKHKAISVYFTNDREVKGLNALWRGKNKATDVLSFSLIEKKRRGEPASNLLGDIVISLPTAKRQARELGVSIQLRTTQLLVHGTLHLLGYDHERVSKRTAQRMFLLEERILDRLT